MKKRSCEICFSFSAKKLNPLNKQTQCFSYRLSSRVWDREHIHTLCAQKLLAENRNHLSISLTLKGATLLNHLGWPVTLDAKQPARNKLERRLQSAWTAALFYRAGFGIFNNKASDLAMPETYLPANALRRDTTVATTRVFAGVRYMGIAHSAERMLLAHYVDGGHMYITSEMRMFNTMAVALSNACTPAVIYCGLCYDDLARLLTGASAFMPAKRRGSDAVTYRVGAERTQYPLFLVETTNTGVFQIALITRVRDYRQRVAKYALQDDFLPAPDDAPALDAMMRLIIAEAIMATTSNKLEREDFWGKAEKNLLMALILYVATLRDQRTGELLPIHERGLGEIYRILSTESFADIDDRFAQLPATHPAQSPYGTGKYSAADPKYHGIHHDGDPQRSVGMRSRPAAGSGA